MKNLIIIIFTFCGLSLMAQYPNPNSLQTGNDGSGGRLSDLSDDLNWQVALGPTNSTTLPTSLTFEPALVVISCPVGAWYDPLNDVVNGFTFPESAWITYDFGGANNCNHSGDVDVFFKLDLNLPATGPCGGAVASSFCYVMDFMSDNQVYQIYINGQQQILNLNADYRFRGFEYRNRQLIELCSDWRSGINEMIVHIKSSNSKAGFLAQARIPDLPTDPTTPICISQNEITVTLDAPEFQVTLSPEDLDAGSYSLCNGVDLSAANATYTCANIGENIATLTVQASINNQFQSSCQTIVNVVEGMEACPDCPQSLSTSLIPNPDFEELANGVEPDDNEQLSRAANWVQATGATSDYFSLLGHANRDNPPGELMEMPPMLNETSLRWVGGWRNTDSNNTAPEDYIEYIGAELLSTLQADTPYTLKLNVGAPRSTVINGLPQVLIQDLIVLGIPDDTNFPISGQDCKQNDGYEEIGRASVNIPEFSWREVTIELEALQNYNKIMFGLSCDTPPDQEIAYFLADDLLLIQGEDPCPSECYSINAEAPLCNEDNASYTYDFTLVNNMTDNSFDKLLILGQDEGFSLDLDGNTLLQLDDTVGPGQSIDLSWTIEGTSTEEATFCFDIIPYNPQGEMCCKEEHCVTLESCCTGAPSASVTINEEEMSEEMCCYSLDYENVCLPDYYTRLQVEMLTPGLGVQAMGGNNTDFTVTPINTSLVELTFNSGTFPEGIYNDVMSFCVTGVSHTSPDVQELRYRWFASVDGGPESIVEINTFDAMCQLPSPPDTCTVITNDNLYCDDNGVYHYSFQVSNFSQGEYDASILVIGPVGDTEPSDFSQQTFPEFPDNTPGAPAFLEYGMTSGVLDVVLPNAQLGDSYQFFLSLHDYRMPEEDGDFWCCFDTLDVITLDIDFDCGIGGLVEDPLSHEIYPNPVEDNFTILFKQRIPADSDIIIKDIRGNLMDIHDIKSETHYHTINTSEYLTGLYFVIVRDSLGNMTHSKFVRN